MFPNIKHKYGIMESTVCVWTNIAFPIADMNYSFTVSLKQKKIITLNNNSKIHLWKTEEEMEGLRVGKITCITYMNIAADNVLFFQL